MRITYGRDYSCESGFADFREWDYSWPRRLDRWLNAKVNIARRNFPRKIQVETLWHSRLSSWSHPIYYFHSLLIPFSSITPTRRLPRRFVHITPQFPHWNLENTRTEEIFLFFVFALSVERKIANDHNTLLPIAITVVYGSFLFSNGRASNPISTLSSFVPVIENPSFPLRNITSILTKPNRSISWWNRHKFPGMVIPG